LSVDLSQVRALSFGQFTLCRDSEGKRLIAVVLALQRRALEPSNGTAAGLKKSAGSQRPVPEDTRRILYTFCQTLTPDCLRSCQRTGSDDLINCSKCYQRCGNECGWPLSQAAPRSDSHRPAAGLTLSRCPLAGRHAQTVEGTTVRGSLPQLQSWPLLPKWRK